LKDRRRIVHIFRGNKFFRGDEKGIDNLQLRVILTKCRTPSRERCALSLLLHQSGLCRLKAPTSSFVAYSFWPQPLLLPSWSGKESRRMALLTQPRRTEVRLSRFLILVSWFFARA